MSIKYMAYGYEWKFKSPTEREVYMSMADHADGNGENIRASLGFIGHKIDCSEDTVRRHIKAMKEQGLLVLVADNSSHGLPNEYKIDASKGIKKDPYKGKGGGGNLQGGEGVANYKGSHPDATGGGSTQMLPIPSTKPSESDHGPIDSKLKESAEGLTPSASVQVAVATTEPVVKPKDDLVDAVQALVGNLEELLDAKPALPEETPRPAPVPPTPPPPEESPRPRQTKAKSTAVAKPALVSGRFTSSKFYIVDDVNCKVWSRSYTDRETRELISVEGAPVPLPKRAVWEAKGLRLVKGSDLNADRKYAAYALTKAPKDPAKQRPVFNAIAIACLCQPADFDSDDLDGEAIGKISRFREGIMEANGLTPNMDRSDNPEAQRLAKLITDVASAERRAGKAARREVIIPHSYSKFAPLIDKHAAKSETQRAHGALDFKAGVWLRWHAERGEWVNCGRSYNDPNWDKLGWKPAQG